MRYKLENNAPVLIKIVTFDGRTISNPSDSFIDEHALGYPKSEPAAPSYDPDTQRLTFAWQVISNVITKVWEVIALTDDEKKSKHNAGIDTQIQAVNDAYTAWQTSMLEYTFGDATMYLKPIWTTQYYSVLQQVGDLTSGQIFPMTVTDAKGVNFTMTREQFQTMYLWLVTQCSTKIAQVNARLAELEAEKWTSTDAQTDAVEIPEPELDAVEIPTPEILPQPEVQ